MMHERDRLQEQLDQMQEGNHGGTGESESARPRGLTRQEKNGTDSDKVKPPQSDHNATITADSTTNMKNTAVNKTEPITPIYDVKEITLEVIKQIKSDMARVLNILVPKPLRDQLSPGLKTFMTVAKDMGVSVYHFVRRHLRAFLDRGGSVQINSASV